MKILIVTSSSGGHIFPAASLNARLIEAGQETLFLLPEKCRSRIRLAPSFKVEYIPAASVSLKDIGSITVFLKNCFASLFLVAAFRPQVAVGFGGIESVPAMFWSWLFRARTIIHEQNVSLGRANSFLSRFVDKVAVSFAQTRNCVPWVKNVSCCGYPLRQELKVIEKKAALDYFGFNPDFLTLLVFGGSQGSRHINDCFLGAVSGISGRNKIQAIHICGAQDYDRLSFRYKELGQRVRLYPFFEEMSYAYSAADLVISRAGAGTIAELIYFSLPALLIPYPHALRHQLKNAALLEQAGCAKVIHDQDLNPEILRRQLDDLIASHDGIERMRQGFGGFPKPDSGRCLAGQVISSASTG
jgi:UDP-N-acetylglucosamine--N-acetylmuramyl-(pentapeptide) pyrophosphoryl-undecaprenol N-acetylglucosamine transferase